MNSKGLGDDSGVNVLLEYLFSLVVVVVLFTILLLLINNITNTSDHIALKGEYDIIANDVANRISAFSSEVYMNDRIGQYDSTIVNGETVYFDLPEPVSNKQYQVDITYTPPDPLAGTPGKGTVKVSCVSDTSIYSVATFLSNANVQATSFNSHQGNYEMQYQNGQIVVWYPQ